MLYYKAGGTPWRLVRDESALESCYVGVSFYWRGDGSAASSVAQVFNERGDGVVVRGGPASRSTDDKQLHQREEDAYELLRDALKAFRNEHKHLPARIVVHKTTSFDASEHAGMMRAVEDQDVESGELIWVSQGTDVRLFRTGAQPPTAGHPPRAPERLRAPLHARRRRVLRALSRSVRSATHRPATGVRGTPDDRSGRGGACPLEDELELDPVRRPASVSIRTARDVSDIVRQLEEVAPVEPRYPFYM